MVKSTLRCEHCGAAVIRDDPLRIQDWYQVRATGEWRTVLSVSYNCTQARISNRDGDHYWGIIRVVDLPADASRIPAYVQQERRDWA